MSCDNLLNVSGNNYNHNGIVQDAIIQNVNNITGAGVFHAIVLSGSPNLPSSHNYTIENTVLVSTGGIIQTANPVIATQGRPSFRTYDGATWSAWQNITRERDMYFKGYDDKVIIFRKYDTTVASDGKWTVNLTAGDFEAILSVTPTIFSTVGSTAANMPTGITLETVSLSKIDGRALKGTVAGLIVNSNLYADSGQPVSILVIGY